MIYYLFDDKFFLDGHKNVLVGSGSLIQDYGSANPDSKEVFMDPRIRIRKKYLRHHYSDYSRVFLISHFFLFTLIYCGFRYSVS